MSADDCPEKASLNMSVRYITTMGDLPDQGTLQHRTAVALPDGSILQIMEEVETLRAKVKVLETAINSYKAREIELKGYNRMVGNDRWIKALLQIVAHTSIDSISGHIARSALGLPIRPDFPKDWKWRKF